MALRLLLVHVLDRDWPDLPFTAILVRGPLIMRPVGKIRNEATQSPYNGETSDGKRPHWPLIEFDTYCSDALKLGA